MLKLNTLNEQNFKIQSFYTKEYSSFDMPLHAHNYIEIMYVTKGKCKITLQIGDKTAETVLYARQFIFIDFDVYHKLTVDSPATIMNIELKPAIMPFPCCLPFKDLKSSSQDLTQFLKNFRDYVVLEDVVGVSKIMRQIYAENMKVAANNDIVTQSLLNVLFVYIARCRDIPLFSYGNSHYNKAIQYITSHIDSAVNIGAIASYVGVSKAHLHRLFKERSGETIVNYINHLKIERAKKLIGNIDMSLIDIAVTLGYQNRQSFFYSFRKETGMSPQTFRKSIQKQYFTIYNGFYQQSFKKED